MSPVIAGMGWGPGPRMVPCTNGCGRDCLDEDVVCDACDHEAIVRAERVRFLEQIEPARDEAA